MAYNPTHNTHTHNKGNATVHTHNKGDDTVHADVPHTCQACEHVLEQLAAQFPDWLLLVIQCKRQEDLQLNAE